MNYIVALISILVVCRADSPVQQKIFDYFDFARGIASSLFMNAGADRLADCMEDGDDIEETVVKVEYLIKNFNPKTMFADLAVLFSGIVSIYDDCRAFLNPVEIQTFTKPFVNMGNAFANDMTKFITKEVVAILAEGTNLMNEINDIIADFNNKKFYEAGYEIGEILSAFTVKLF